MDNSDYKGLNEGKKQVAEAVESGVWADTTTKPNRYSGYVEAVVQLAEEGYLQPGQELTVLDIGASTGKATEGFEAAVEYHTDLQVNTVSYDINRTALEHNQSNQRSGGYVQGTAADVRSDSEKESSLPFAEGAFDIVLSKTLLSRQDGAHQSKALQEINRVLDEDGVAAVEIDPDGMPRAHKGYEHVVKASLFDRAVQTLSERTKDAEENPDYSIDLDPWSVDLKRDIEQETPDPADTDEQYGGFDDDSEIITEREDSGQFENTYDGAEIIGEVTPSGQFGSHDDGAVVV